MMKLKIYRPENLILGLITSLILFQTSPLAADESVVGLWAGSGSIIKITANGDQLHSKILAVDSGVYSLEEAEKDQNKIAGAPRQDDHNPDESLRSRLIIGMELFTNYRLADGQWQGKMYDPGSGNTYQSKMKVKNGNLEIRGYIGIPLFGRTAIFEPVSRCAAETVKMLQMTDLKTLCDNPGLMNANPH